MSTTELMECRNTIYKYFTLVKQEIAKMQQNDGEKAKAFHATLQQLSQRMGHHPAPAPRPAEVPAAAPPSQPALNANNLQRHSEQLAEQHRTQLAQKAGRMSPDGSPPIVIRSNLTVDDLRLPPNIRKRKADGQPQDSSPSKIKSPKPAQATTPQVTTSPQVKNRPPPPPPPPPVEKNFKCDRQGCGAAFTLKNELADHQKKHEREAEKRREEEGKAKFRIDNPLEYTLASVANALHVNREGIPKDMKVAPTNGVTPKPGTTPQIKTNSSPLPGSTPLRQAMTPKSKSPAQTKMSLSARPTGSKAIAPDGEQVPTPPATFWDTPGSPTAIRQCFEGIEDVSPLATLDSSLFTPAYTPEDTSGDDKAAAAISTYEDWNPWGMKDACGTEVLQDFPWDNEVPVCSTKEGPDWGEMNQFMLFAQ
jgi:hypothetical protein